jgi:hypothetical protein
MAENPYQSAASVILGVVAIGITAALLLPSSRGVPVAKWRSQCAGNTRQILIALLKFEKEHGSLPPAYTVDDQGNRLHSWRTLILPHLEEHELYEQIDFAKPWDDPKNAQARDSVVDVYLCPAADHEEDCTTYLAVVGPGGAFFGSSGKRIDELKGGVVNTVALVDISFRDAVHWMSPEDISVDELLLYDSETRLQHGRSIVVATLDGRVEVIELDKDREKLHALLKGQPLPEK